MDLSLYKEDQRKQNEGSPMHVGDSTFYVRRWGTKESQIFLRDLKKRLFGPFHKSQEDDDKILFSEWLCGYGVTGWENVTDGEQEIVFSKPVARDIFTNPEYYMSLNAILIQDAMNFENYLYDEAQEDIDALKKN